MKLARRFLLSRLMTPRMFVVFDIYTYRAEDSLAGAPAPSRRASSSRRTTRRSRPGSCRAPPRRPAAGRAGPAGSTRGPWGTSRARCDRSSARRDGAVSNAYGVWESSSPTPNAGASQRYGAGSQDVEPPREARTSARRRQRRPSGRPCSGAWGPGRGSSHSSRTSGGCLLFEAAAEVLRMS